MKKQLYMLACAAIITAGCSSEEDILQKPSIDTASVSITASFDGVTRAYTVDGKKSAWTSSDKIYVGAGSSMAEYQVKDIKTEDEKSVAVFEGSKVIAENSYAVYGGVLSASNTMPIIGSDYKVTGISIPTEWAYDHDPSNNCANVLLMGKVTADGSSKHVIFKHAGAVLFVKLGSAASSLKAIKVTSGKPSDNADFEPVKISGEATISWNADAPSYICDGTTAGTTITIKASGDYFADDENIVVPIPAATYGSLKVEGSVDGSTFGTSILNIEPITIERNKSYKVEYTGVPATITNAEELQAAFTKAMSKDCSVKIANDIVLDNSHQAFTISGTNATVVDLNGKTLTANATDGKVSLSLNVGSDTKTSTNTPSSQRLTIKNGTIKIDPNATETVLTITNACNISLEGVKFEVPVPTSSITRAYTIYLDINNELALDSDGNTSGDIMSFSYNGKGCTINDKVMKYPDFFIKKDFEIKSAHKDVEGGTIILQIKKAGSN